VTDRIVCFPRISPISQLDRRISTVGRDRQERQRHIEIGEEELDANPVRVAKNTPYAMHRLKPHTTVSLAVLTRGACGDPTETVDSIENQDRAAESA
jgi:hypothetical protein